MDPNKSLLKTMRNIKGFTLIEVMVVIVILGIFTAIIGMSVGAGFNRKNVQQYDQLVDDLKYIRTLSIQEEVVLGLQVVSTSNLKDGNYRLVMLNKDYLERLMNPKQSNELENSSNVKNRKFGKYDGLSVDLTQDTSSNNNKKQKKWLLYSSTYQKPINRTFKQNMQLLVEPLENNHITSDVSTSTNSPLFQNDESPPILWFGNGEATPVKLVFKLNDKQIGDAIYINKLGKVSTNSAELGL